MPRTNVVPLLAGAAVLLGLALGAGFLGATLASDPAAAPSVPVQRSLPDSAVRARLDEFDRRLESVEERLRVAEDTANQALSLQGELDVLRRDVAALAAGGTVSVSEGSAPRADGTPPGRSAEVPVPATTQTDEERRAVLIESMRKIAERSAPGIIRQHLQILADATPDGAGARNSQVYSEARRLAVVYRLTADEEETLRDILGDAMDESVREVAPYLGGGLERADYGQIKQKLNVIWDRRDGRMREILDEQEFEEFLESRKGFREMYDRVFDDLERERLAPPR